MANNCRTSVRLFFANIESKLVNARGLNQSEFVSDQQQDEQQHRQPYPQCQGVDCAIGFALVAHEEQQCRCKTADDKQEGNGNNDFHGKCGMMPWLSRYDGASIFGQSVVTYK